MTSVTKGTALAATLAVWFAALGAGVAVTASLKGHVRHHSQAFGVMEKQGTNAVLYVPSVTIAAPWPESSSTRAP